MTQREAYNYGEQVLKQAEIEDAKWDAWYLLEFVTGTTRARYFLDMNLPISQEEEQRYRELVEKRALHIPLQHITGVQEFMGLEFDVNEHVLIPRQDTEVLVESVLSILKPGGKVLDMCTGSGCIAISLKKFQEEAEVTAVDISPEALQTARINARKLDAEVQFLQSNLFEKVEGSYDLIVSNPPYIPTKVIEGLKEEVRVHDPILALDGKEDGLYFYREIIRQAGDFLKHKGKLYFEIGHDQGKDVEKLMVEAGFCEVIIKKDLAGLDRVVFGTYN